jgi:uncharacterized circularly permuted ATP-grasp superfamily protein/uncharacterized alpha-E superfamily protein
VPLSAVGSDLTQPGHSDRLLAAYQAAHAQLPFFDADGGTPDPTRFGSVGHDEFIDANGTVRPWWRELAELLGTEGRDGLDRLRSVVRGLVDNDGITYIEVDRNGETVTDDQGIAAPGPWPLDGLPLLVDASDWDVLEAGLKQRARLLDAVLADLYGERRALTSAILPPQLLFGHPGYVRAVAGIENPGRHQLFMLGCDVSRAADGRFLVNADWTQAPSGAGYALADRRIVANALPAVYERVGPRPASPFAHALRLALIDAAPEAAEDPVVVVLSPGIHSETSFDQAYLASVLGFPLVESADLVVRDGKLWMRSLGTLKRVDVVFRRVDAAYVDPLDLRPDSHLGVVGLVEAQRRGTVSVVNTVGSGILESPGLQRFLPQLAERLLGEKPLLDTPQLYWAGIDRERSHLLANMSSLMIRSTVGGPSVVGPALSSDEREELTRRIEAVPWQWIGQDLPQFSSAPTDHDPSGLAAASVGCRVFAVSQSGGYAAMVGGLGYVLAPGEAAFELKSIAAKDVWVRPHARVKGYSAASDTATAQPVQLPSGTRFISSPRVLSDLFWIGRYAERAESLARLLIVSRERYHEYRYREDMAGSECVPVLLASLGQLTGTDAGAAGSYSETVGGAQRTLWSMTVDRHRTGSLAQSVDRLGLAARSVRDQMSNDTWMVLGAVERALSEQADSPPSDQNESLVADDTQLAAAQQQALAGMLALSGVAAESMVHDAGWTMMDIGKRIERGLALSSLLRSGLGLARNAEAERAITESILIACESSVIYRRRNLGMVSIAAVAELLLFDGENPRSLAYQLERLRLNLRALPGSSGSSRPERLVDEIGARLRRLDPSDLEGVDADGRRTAFEELLGGMHRALRDLSDIITRTQLSVPGGMQPLWGRDQDRDEQ